MAQIVTGACLTGQSPRPVDPTGSGPLRLCSVHRYSRLRDVSASGRTALVWVTQDPVSIIRMGIPIRARGSSELQLIEISGGRVVGRAKVSGQVKVARFLVGSESSGIATCFERGFLTGTWSAGQPLRVKLTGDDAIDFAFLQVTGPDSGISASYRDRGPNGEKDTLLNRLDLRALAVTERIPVRTPDVNSNVGRGIVSKAAGLVAFETAFPDPRLIVRKLKDFSLVYQIRAPSGFGFGEMVFSEKGDWLIAAAMEPKSTGALARFLVIYEAKTGRDVRRIPIQPAVKLALSPNDRVLAVGERREVGPNRAQAVLKLLDFQTGESIGQVAHRAVEVPRNNPWAGQFNSIAFTPDGKYLLTSETDTCIWRVASSIR